MIRTLIPFPDMVPLATRMADELDAEVRPLAWHRFPDGESLVTLPAGLDGAEVIIVATLCDPDTHALALRFAAATARELGAAHVGLVAPYLAYMRQDRRFHDGEAISAPLFARFLGESFDWLVTVDPHLHRIAQLSDIFPMPAICVAAAPLLADWIVREVPDAVILGPDSESQQWVAKVAEMAGRPYEVLRKVRSGDRQVDISVPERVALREGTPVILDDIASSGRTMVGVIERLRAKGIAAPVCIVMHAVFAGKAYEDILAAGAARVVSTDTIPHVANTIGVSGLLAGAVLASLDRLDLAEGQSRSIASIRTRERNT